VLQQQSMIKKSLRLTEQLRLTQQRLKIRELQHIKYRDLAEQGLVSKTLANESQEKLLNEQLQVNSLHQQLEQVDSDIMRVDTEIVALTASKQQQLAQLNRHLSELKQQIARQKRHSEQTLVAQHDGIVSAITIKAGQNIKRGQFLFVLTPLNPTFYAELIIPSRAVAFVQPGTEASLKLNAFPFEKFGALKANITQISKTPLPVDNTKSTNPAESMYQVIAQLSTQHIKAYGIERPLQDGMRVMADLHIERRSLVEWLIDPLIAAVGE
jgi:membrane fusion protein